MEYEYFRDHRPAAEHHYLVIPKKHFEKITTLTKQDIPMIRRMEKIGMEVNSNSIIYFIVITRFLKNLLSPRKVWFMSRLPLFFRF